MSSVKGHSYGGGGPGATALHQAMAGKEMAAEHTHTSRMSRDARESDILHGYEIGLVMAQ